MQIAATVRNTGSSHAVSVVTAGRAKTLAVPANADGPGSSVNGGELLMLALATVEASADFEGIGLAASNVRYHARVSSPAPESQIAALLRETDAVAEVHNTLRAGVPVERVPWDSAA